MTTPKNIFERINEIRKEVVYIVKDAEVQNYQAVTHDMVTAKLHDHLVKYGVIIYPSLVSQDSTEYKTRSGSRQLHYEAVFAITFLAADLPESCFTIHVPAHADDTSDKAPGSAVSYATKVAMLKVFSLETGVNEESRVEEERRAEPVGEEGAATLRSLLEQYGKSEEDFVKKVLPVQHVRVNSLEELTPQVYEWSKQFLEKKIEEANATG